MAEVAGTIFGVISLSIQLFDKLNTYTNSVKDARTKAEQITGELDTLVNLLENLETIISRLDPTTSTALTRNSIQECAKAIDVIRSRLGDVLPAKGSIRFWTRSRNLIKRLAYPFKESDIKYWKDVLASIQQSLQTALLASQTDQQQRYFTTLQAQLDQLSLNTSAGFQMILDQQRRAQALTEQTISQSSGAEISSYRRHQGSVQSLFRKYDRSVAQDNLFDSRSQIGSKIERHRDLSDLLLPVSAVDLEEDITNLRNLEWRIRPNRLRLEKKPDSSISCTCRGSRQEKQLVRSPFVVSLDEVHSHESSCPFWIPGAHDVSFSFGVILCYLILGLKLRIFMTLSIASGTFSVNPSLSACRIVSENSPAFELIERIFHFPYVIPPMDSSTELTRLFQARKASPHDRLRDGTTLLHRFCEKLSSLRWAHVDPDLFDWDGHRSFANHILRYMSYADASDTNDRGETCLDILLQLQNLGPSWMPYATNLLQHDLRISSKSNPFGTNVRWVLFPFNEFPDSFAGFSDVTVAALSRSEAEFSRLVPKHYHNDVLKQEEGSDLYGLATRMGWVRGCQILFDAGFKYTTRVPEGSRNESFDLWRWCLLRQALDSRNQDMVQFWLEERQRATPDLLGDIGDPERAVVHALQFSGVNMAKVLLSHLAKQRSSLRETVDLSGIECQCAMKSKGLLDAHATCALRTLDEQGLGLPHSSWPTYRNIYNITTIYSKILLWDKDPLRILNLLYEAGFRDIAKADIKCCRNDPYLPIHIAIKHYSERAVGPHLLPTLFKMVDWFLSRGADLTDHWPRSRATTLHCISAKAAFYFSPSIAETTSDDTLDRVADLFQHASTDDCECSCSTHGCKSITAFCKPGSAWLYANVNTLTSMTPGNVMVSQRLEGWQKRYRKRNAQQRFTEFVQCVARAAEGVTHRWIVTEFIRLCIFSWLEIRHTCCDLNKILKADESDFPHQPVTRYPPDDLRRIQEEDTHLVVVLEEMVPLFDARYDTHKGNLQSFVDEILLPEMGTVLDRLKQEDEASYATRRWEMGVVMVNE